MKKDLIEMVFILDRSGSMSGLESDTIGGFNSMIEKQKKIDGQAIISTVLFNHEFKVLHNRVDSKDIEPLNEKDYYVSGSTALIDAIGRSINKIGNIQKYTPKELRAEKVIFVITTDGMENASRQYTYETLKMMVDRQKEKYGWEFIFLGANIDAMGVASRFGINEDRVANYHADSKGTNLNYEVISDALCEFRTSKKISGEWKNKINKDYSNRNK
ncbi:vWA domain-containing protein [Mariniplasma anaerobium]|uniref:Uncharacterized protein n=1 Tax=Mariniplasma anaerobium TaxID=2735436 RepID=A0A7U9TJS1_9MOLU|nr:vWA domain-containing protein [Mariniplasma anaerobium]BCR36677.1 hypothetical protein MPAN_015700 [Mariniplasma anaerobium]